MGVISLFFNRITTALPPLVMLIWRPEGSLLSGSHSLLWREKMLRKPSMTDGEEELERVA
jgi:hypothetical protein